MKIKKKSKSPTMRKNNETNFNKSNRDNNLNRSFNPSQSVDMGNVDNINNSNVQSGKQINNKPFILLLMDLILLLRILERKVIQIFKVKINQM